MALPEIQHTVVDRFLKYVTFDTQSAEESKTFPSTEKQKILGKYLKDELLQMGLYEVEFDEFGYIYATLESNLDKKVPTIGLIAHMDTSPDVSGANVHAVIHRNYQGNEITFPGNPDLKLIPAENPALKNQIGHDIITTDGTTLLGADNKAGIAEILDAIHFFIHHPEIKHGKIRIAITPDEEVGMGTRYFDVKKFGCDYAYTIDGETLGEVENETFCADSLTLLVSGVNLHPGYAKNKLVNSLKIAAEIIEHLPKDSLSPETTEKREGYVHPHQIQGGVEETIVKFLIRDFKVEGLKEKEQIVEKLAREVMIRHPRARLEVKVDESYRNMLYVLEKYPEVIEKAVQAIQAAGITPIRGAIRGGTDGSRLCYEGLPTPNIFTGGHNFHSKTEWISIQDMKKAVEVIINLILIWAE
ncbi:peptidase T [candidate division KSB1 bacterium]|nr:peptidase T [candidate division KSB1 bacterium]